MPPNHQECIVGQGARLEGLLEALSCQGSVSRGEGEGLDGVEEIRGIGSDASDEV